MTLYGTNYSDLIVDDAYDNDIDALGGNDLIIAASEQAFEEINGGDGIDTISYVNVYGINVDIGPVTQGFGYAQQTWDLLTSIENVIGSKGVDTLIGNQVDNELFGLAGDDVFEGKGGGDKLSGGDGFDTASYRHAAAGVEVWLDLGKGFGSEAQGDRFFGIERVLGSEHGDMLRGNAGRNTFEGGGGADDLMGLGGNDALHGGDGADRMVGGSGADQQTGGAGADLFRYFDDGDSFAVFGHRDTILDFNHSSGDRLDFSVIDAKAGTSGLQAFHFIGDADFSAEGQIRAYSQDGEMIVEANTSGVTGADMSILVADIVGLSAADFIL